MESWSRSVPAMAVVIRLPLSLSIRGGAVSRATSCAASTPAPITPASAPPRARATVVPLPAAPATRASRPRARPASRNRSAARERPPPITMYWGSNTFTYAGDRHAEHAPEVLEHAAGRRRRPPSRRLHQGSARHLAVRAESRGEPAARACRARPGLRRARGPGRCNRPRCSRWPGHLPGAGRPVGVDRQVAELGAEAVRAAEDLAADHHPAAHAGPEGEHHERARRGVVHELRLCERGAVGVVVHEHGYAEAPAELLAQRHPRERDVHARFHRAGGVLDLRGNANPHRRRPTDLVDHPAHGRLDAVQQLVGGALAGGVLGRLAGGHTIDRRHGDLRAANVDAEDHPGIPIPARPSAQARLPGIHPAATSAKRFSSPLQPPSEPHQIAELSSPRSPFRANLGKNGDS